MIERALFDLADSVVITEPMRFGLQELAEHRVGSGHRLILEIDETLGDQAYCLHPDGKDLTLLASGDAGFLYGLLDLRYRSWQEPYLQHPYIKKRGIKYNIPLDARTPSYSDASDIALNSIEKVWDLEFWKRYLDLLARHKYNLLSLWSLSPFPSLVKTPGYEQMSLSDVKVPTLNPKPSMSGDTLYTEEMEQSLVTVHTMTIEEKIEFWNRVLSYAKSRCIEVYLFTWNLFIFPNALGLTSSLDDDHTAEYLYRSVEALFENYPLLAGIGITAGEGMSGQAEVDIPYLYQTYGGAVAAVKERWPDRAISLIHRTHWAATKTVLDHYDDYPAHFALSFKYANAHLHSHRHPRFLDAFIKEVDPKVPLFLTLRDDDYYLHRWSDPAFARRFIENLPSDRIEGFYLGSDGYSWGWEGVSQTQDAQLYVEKHWFKIALFGQLSYDPTLDEGYWLGRFLDRYQSLEDLYFANFCEASSLLREVTCLHWRDWDFQWYVEGCCEFLHPPIAKLSFVSVIDFLEGESMPHSGYLSIRHWALNPEKMADEKHPLRVAQRLRHKSDRILSYRNDTLSTLKATTTEITEMSADIESMALLGAYYARKIEAAYLLGRAIVTGSECDECLVLLDEATDLWQQYSQAIHTRYRPQRFARLCSYIDFRQFDQSARFDRSLCVEYCKRAREGDYALVD